MPQLSPHQGGSSAPPGEPLLLTARDAARLLAVSERTLWALTDAGELPCVRLGRAVRYSVADLHALIARRRQTGPPGRK